MLCLEPKREGEKEREENTSSSAWQVLSSLSRWEPWCTLKIDYSSESNMCERANEMAFILFGALSMHWS